MRENKYKFYYKNKLIETLTLKEIAAKCNFHWADDVITCDYIGRHDRNGKEIYDGDFVRYENKDAEYIEGTGVGLIQIDSHSHCVNGFSCRDIKTKHYVRLLCGHDLFSIEIIGNIHENPELLEEIQATG